MGNWDILAVWYKQCIWHWEWSWIKFSSKLKQIIKKRGRPHWIKEHAYIRLNRQSPRFFELFCPLRKRMANRILSERYKVKLHVAFFSIDFRYILITAFFSAWKTLQNKKWNDRVKSPPYFRCFMRYQNVVIGTFMKTNLFSSKVIKCIKYHQGISLLSIIKWSYVHFNSSCKTYKETWNLTQKNSRHQGKCCTITLLTQKIPFCLNFIW